MAVHRSDAMLPIEQRAGCYCCVKPPLSTHMDIDTALSELGMLSSSTQSRRQYLQEKEQHRRRVASRERFLSEPADLQDCVRSDVSVPHFTTISESLATSPQTPSNSPSKGGGYQILQLNMNYVTELSTCTPKKDADPSALSMDLPTTSQGSDKTWFDLSQDYSKSDSFSKESKTGRLAKSKMSSRLRRFRKPYDIPWRHSIESYYSDHSASPPLSSTFSASELSLPEKAQKRVTYPSNSSTPEKTHPAAHGASVPRSKSLDDLDLAKLKLAEAESNSSVLEKHEIDRVSQHFNDLHVGE